MDTKIHDILMVLAIGVFADKKIHSSEIQVFIQSVSRIPLTASEVPMISEAKALSWFEMNKQLIREKFEGPRDDFDVWFIPILERVGEYANKDELLNLLSDIFLADDEVHISESAMMVLVKQAWGIA